MQRQAARGARAGSVRTGPRHQARISHLDPADLPESRGNAGETPDPFFHPSRPSGFGFLVHRNSLTQQLKSGHGAGRTPVHLGNPGLEVILVVATLGMVVDPDPEIVV